MGFLRIPLFLILLIIIQVYTYKRNKEILKTKLPNATAPLFLLKLAYVIFNIFPFFWVSQLILRFTGVITSFYNPKNMYFDYLMIYPFWLVFILMIQLLPFYLLSDGVRLVIKKWFRTKLDVFTNYQYSFLLTILCVFLVYIPARSIYDDHAINVHELTHEISNLHPDLENLKIVLISDIQADYYTDKKRLGEYVKEVNSENADLIFIAGDMITNTPDYIDLAGEVIGKLQAKYGVYACAGDHDHWAYPTRSHSSFQRSLSDIKASLEKGNVPVLINENHHISVNKATVKLTATDQNYAYRQIDREMLDSLTRSGNEQAELKLFLNHQPNQDLIDKAKQYDYDIFLTGHTHGGQIVFWYPPFFKLSGSTFETPYIKGHYFVDDLLVAVSAGLGVSIAPIRYNATPEIVSIRLTSGNRLLAKTN